MVNMSSAVFTHNNSKANSALQCYNKNISHQQQQQLSAAVKMFKYQNIAPAPAMSMASGGCTGAEIKTRKYTPRAPSNGGGPYSVDQTQSVQRRNARERNRVKQVNNSFARLRQHIPQTIITDLLKGGGRGPHKKISKVDTLRIAVEYIRRLQDLVDDLNAGSSGSGNTSNAAYKMSSARSADGLLLAAAADNNTTSSNSSFSSNSSSNLSILATDSPARHTPHSSGLAAAEQLYYASAASSALQAFQHQQQQQQQQQFTSTLLTADALQAYTAPQAAPTTQTQLDIGCPSPTSSFNSSMSFDSGTFVHSPVPHASSGDAQRSGNGNHSGSAQIDANLQLKFEPYDSFNLHEEDCAPDDEEILDYISLWQEQ